MTPQVIFGLIITIILIVLGLVFSKSKKIFILQMIFFWIMTAFNDGGVDYTVHTGIYDTATNEVGFFNSGLYILLCYIAKKNNISFFILNMIFNTLCTIIIYKIVKKESNNHGFVGSCLMIYPLIENVIQKRFLIGATIAILGFYILMKKENHYKIKSAILILIGGLMHQSIMTLFTLYILQQLNLKFIKKFIWVFVIIGYLSIPVIPKIASLIFPGSKVELYFYTLRVDLVDGICWMFLHIIFVLIIELFFKYIRNENKDYDENLANEIHKLNLNSLILLPLYYYEPTFIRLFRSFLVLDYILVSNKMSKPNNLNKITKNQFYLCLVWILYLICTYSMIYIFTGAGFNALVIPEYTYNVILRFVFGG